jgi:general secretion pathway protein L
MQSLSAIPEMPATGQTTGFFAWWMRELRGIFVRQSRATFTHPKRRLIAAIDENGVRWLDETDQSLKPIGPESPTAEPGAAALKTLQRLTSKRRSVPLGLRIGRSACFERRVELPTAARPDFARILALDIERATPFKHRDVYTAFCEDRGASPPKGKVAVRQFIVKRERIDEPRQLLRAQGIDTAFADCWDETGTKPLAIDFLSKPLAASATPRPPQTLAKLLALTALVLAGTAAGLAIQRGNSTLQELEAKVTDAKTRAQTVRKSVDQAEAVFKSATGLQNLRQRHIPVADVLEELTRLLPDTTYVTDFRIDAGKVAITGLSQSAAALVPLIESSDVFEGATMTAPILFDTNANKEQYKIEARLHTTAASVKPHEEPAP